MTTDSLTALLKQTSTLVPFDWIVLLHRTDDVLHIAAQLGLSTREQNAVKDLLALAKYHKWVEGTLTSRRMRSRAAPETHPSLKTERMFAIPAKNADMIMLVGAEKLTETSRNALALLSLALPIPADTASHAIQQKNLPKPLPAHEALQFNLEKLLQPFAVLTNASIAYLAVREGENYRIHATYPENTQQTDEYVSGTLPALSLLTTRKRAQLLTDHDAIAPLITPLSLIPLPQAWLAAPIPMGHRIIGFIAGVTANPDAFTAELLSEAEKYAKYIAQSVDNAIIFAEAERHLQRLALLNELASAASLGLDVRSIARRVVRMVRRKFDTEQVALLYISPDGVTLQEHGRRTRESRRLEPEFLNDLRRVVLEKNQFLRIDTQNGKKNELTLPPNTQAALALPLKSRGRTIGTLEVRSDQPRAFTRDDEQLLTVLASQLAGMLENANLNEEMRLRASNLELIHQVVREIVGLTDLSSIGKAAAELTAQHFGYEMALVLVADQAQSNLWVEGVGGAQSHRISAGTHFSADLPFVQNILNMQTSMLYQNLTPKDELVPTPKWNPGSRMTAPFREGKMTFGMLVVERAQPDAYTQNDLLVLEALAGVMSSVLTNARRYRQYQVTIAHLEAARITSLDIADLDFDTVLKRVVQRARDLVGATGAELGLVDEETKSIRILISENPWYEYRGHAIPMDKGVAGVVAASGKPIVVEDYNNWENRINSDRPAPFWSVAAVPLKLQGATIGTLMLLEDRKEKRFRPEDIQLLEMLAPQIAVSIRNARLYQALQDQSEAQKLAEAQLVRSARLAAVGEMAAGVAHELNNPLTTIAGFTELMLEEIPVNSPQKEDLALVLQESQRARLVVRRLLDFSRHSESLKEISDINVIIQEVLAIVHHMARTGGVNIEFNTADDLPEIFIDRNQIKQVVINLVQNGIQAMPDGGKMEIQTKLRKRDEEGWVTIDIRDYGVGITKHNMDRIFEPFFTTKPVGSGTGLGLSISYGILAEHGGFMEIESEPGTGSLFRIWLPNRKNDL